MKPKNTLSDKERLKKIGQAVLVISESETVQEKWNRLETDVNIAKTVFLDLIKDQLRIHAGSRKQYQLTRESFGCYPDSEKRKGKKIIDLKELYSIKSGKIPSFKIEKVILGLKSFFEKKAKKI